MCLYPIHSKTLIAEKDIKVYKMLVKGSNELLSPYQDYPYKLRTLYSVKTKLNNKSLNLINKGLHAYTDIIRAERQISYGSDRVIYEAKIPKGSLYKMGSDQDIVSNQLIVLKKYKVK